MLQYVVMISRLIPLLGLGLLALSVTLAERPRAATAPPQRWAGQTIVTMTPTATSATLTATAPPPDDTPAPPTDTPPPPTPTATVSPEPGRGHVFFLPSIHTANYGEPNDHCGQAHLVQTNAPRLFRPEDRQDWYRFTTPASGRLVIRVTGFAPIEGQVAAYQGESCSQAITLGNYGTPGQTKTLDLGSRPAGAYFIFVGNDGPLMDQPYQLAIEFTANE